MKKKALLSNPDIWMLTVTLIWGFNTPAMKQIITEIDQWTFVGFRFICISIISVISFFGIQRRRDLFRFKRNDLIKISIASFFAFGAYQYFLMNGLSKTPVFLATILGRFQPTICHSNITCSKTRIIYLESLGWDIHCICRCHCV